LNHIIIYIFYIIQINNNIYIIYILIILFFFLKFFFHFSHFFFNKRYISMQLEEGVDLSDDKKLNHYHVYEPAIINDKIDFSNFPIFPFLK